MDILGPTSECLFARIQKKCHPSSRVHQYRTETPWPTLWVRHGSLIAYEGLLSAARGIGNEQRRQCRHCWVRLKTLLEATLLCLTLEKGTGYVHQGQRRFSQDAGDGHDSLDRGRSYSKRRTWAFLVGLCVFGLSSFSANTDGSMGYVSTRVALLSAHMSLAIGWILRVPVPS